jgi:hypothetical protein
VILGASWRVWINELNKHFPGALFGDYKQSGIGREECMEEMLAYRQEKTIRVRLRPGKARGLTHAGIFQPERQIPRRRVGEVERGLSSRNAPTMRLRA